VYREKERISAAEYETVYLKERHINDILRFARCFHDRFDKGRPRRIGERCSMNTRDFITVSKRRVKRCYARIALAIGDCICVCVS